MEPSQKRSIQKTEFLELGNRMDPTTTSSCNRCIPPTLQCFLQERLPVLGLDYDLYGMYIEPLFTETDTTTTTILSNTADNDEDVYNYNNSNNNQSMAYLIDEEEWDTVITLLQASSETHSDNDTIFQQFKQELYQLWKQHQESIYDEEQRMHQQQKELMRVQLEKEILEINQQLLLASTTTAVDNNHDTKEWTKEEINKRALLNRFAYEEPDNDMEDDADVTIENNSKNTERHSIAATSSTTTTKKEEQLKTKESKLNKLQIKEERRKRAVKGERKR